MKTDPSKRSLFEECLLHLVSPVTDLPGNDFVASMKLPTRKDAGPSARPLGGFYVEEFSGEAAFVPTKTFLNRPPLWRLDVLHDLMHDLEVVRRFAILDLAETLAESNPPAEKSVRLRAFRDTCSNLGIHLPGNIEALLLERTTSDKSV